MSASASGAHQRAKAVKESRAGASAVVASTPRKLVSWVQPGPANSAEVGLVRLGNLTRLSLMLTPKPGGSFGEQARQVVSNLASTLQQQAQPMVVTTQTVFLRHPEDESRFKRILAACYGKDQPLTSYVLQPPCNGALLAVEAWAIGGKSVRVKRYGAHAIAVSYDGVRWVSCGGLRPKGGTSDAYAQTLRALRLAQSALRRANSDLEHMVRTWFYLGNITQPEGAEQRYQAMNRARTHCYKEIRFCRPLLEGDRSAGVYPASTGIGMSGGSLVAGCLALHTERRDAFLLHLQNPRQTPAYAYHRKYSPESPKFARAIALVTGRNITTWVSGTASIVNSESLHRGNIRKQTEQTIDNIESLISPENFAAHGIRGSGARLTDLAKIRVYVKRQADYLKCKEVCERRFGPVPVIYALADVCRPELLVEIEGVAFSRRA